MTCSGKTTVDMQKKGGVLRVTKALFLTLTCFLMVFLPAVNGVAQAATCNPGVQIVGGGTATTIQGAYNTASSTLTNFTLRLSGEIFSEDLLLNSGNVVLDGGYDCTFTTKTGSPTGLFGTITIGGTGSANFAGDVGVVSTTQCSFDADLDGYFVGSCAVGPLDCNDNDPSIHPGALEICDGIDNNCNGQIDEGILPVDLDGDGYYSTGSCGASPYTDDCDDNDPSSHPGALDIPYDGIDQDCNGSDMTFADVNSGVNCTWCHGSASTWTGLHNLVTAPDLSCATCHAANVGNILPGHFGDTVLTAGNNMTAGATIVCTSCHDMDNTTTPHSGGPLGSATSFVWSKAKLVKGSVTCDTCHETRASLHATATAHNNRTIDNSCGVCHTSDTTVLGQPGTGSLIGAADVDALHRSDCALCHSYTGVKLNAAIVRQVIQQGVSGTPVTCSSCHTVSHAAAHTVEVGVNDLSYDAPGQLCSSCHVVSTWAEIEGIEHNVPTNGVGSCATCHNSTRPEVMTAISLKANPTNCLNCHSDKNLTVHGNVDHLGLGYVTGGATYCMICHDPGTAANATVVTTHKSNCALCHSTVPNLNPSIPVLPPKSARDCATCHATTWEVLHPIAPVGHSNLVQVGTSSCASCHDNTLVSTAVNTHNACTSCHNAADGTLKSLAIGKDFLTAGDCTTCHTSSWEVTHTSARTPDHTALVTISGTGTTGTSCASCHLDPPPLTNLSDPKVHNTCGTCHNADGSRVTLNGTDGQTFAVGGNCASCHTSGFSGVHPAHTSAHTVAVGAGDLSYDAPGTLCSSCHVVSTWAEIEGVEHNVSTNGAGSCATCHNSLRAEVVAAIAAGANPTNCLDCHSNKLLTAHGNVDHVVLTYVSVTPSCATLTCHDPGTAANGTITGTHLSNCALCHTSVPALQPGVPAGGGECATCHTNSWEVLHTVTTPDHSNLIQVGTSSCATCHDNTLTSAALNTHNACTSCHNVDGSLVTLNGTNTQNFTTGGDCTTCHGSSWGTLHTVAPNHSTLVTTTGTDNCATCHENALTGATATTHLADCSNCHSVASGALVGNAIGKTFAVGGNCATCHTSSWEATHSVATPSHTALVTVATTSCASCHTDGPLISAAADTHNACITCHNSNGSLVTLNGTNLQNFTTGGDCTTCHTAAWGTLHTVAPNHSTLVTTTGTDNCATCHENALTGATATTHLADCSNCHSVTNGALVSSAVGKTFAVGGNCATCHTSTWEATHSVATPSHAALVTVATTSCASCHIDGPLVSAAADTHNACITCHNSNGSLVTLNGTNLQNFTTGGDCTTCHTAAWGTLHAVAPDHSALVTTTGTDNCATCHENALTGATATTHLADCSNCHSVTNGALVSSAVGKTFAVGGNCATCHSTGWTGIHTELNAPSHTSLVTTSGSTCATCHATPPPLTDNADLKVHNACTSCHTANGNLTTVNGTNLQNFTAGGNCATCHTAAWLTTHDNANRPNHGLLVTTGTSDCASCHDNSLLADAGLPGTDTHLGCATCHNTDGSLKTIAAGKTLATVGDCTSCHGATWSSIHTSVNAPNHSTLVTTTGSSCASCHDNSLLADAGLPGNDTHLDCASCHNATSGALAVRAAGKTFTTGGNCATCHTEGWEPIHTTITPVHTTLVTVTGSTCASCHNDTKLVDAADLKVHNTCGTCHNVDGSLVITNGTNTQTFATGGNCATCHTSAWETIHNTANTPSHNTLVTISGTGTTGTSCASCHADPPPLINAGDPKVHNSCSTCHTVSGSLTTVNGTNTQNFTTGGNCATCHTSGFDNVHTHIHTVALGSSDLSNGNACSNCHNDSGGSLATFADIVTEHNVATNGAGSCATCHNSARAEVVAAIAAGANPTNCLTCHTDKTAGHGNVDHVALGYVTGGGGNIPCLNCHATGDAVNGTIMTTHFGDCNNCHTTVPNLKPGIPAGGGNCATCHTTSVHHDTVQAKYGVCETCHTWPADLDAKPKQLACVQCHTATQHGKNPNGAIQDFRICMDCHAADNNGSMQSYYSTRPIPAMPAIPLHAKATASSVASPSLAHTQAPLGAGRGSFNLYFSTYGGKTRNKPKYQNNTQMGKNWNSSVTEQHATAKVTFTTTTINEKGTNYTVPVFTNIAAANLLASCTSCHTDNSSLVACANTKWTDHLSLNRVNRSVYDLAETTYMGATCANQTPDTLAPTVTAFSLPGTSATPIPVLSYSASDDKAVTGYLITESPVAPAAGAAGWVASAPTSITTGSTGLVTFYAWAKDAAGNVSTSLSAIVSATGPDLTAPTVTAFSLPASGSSPIAVTSFTASDDTAVAGYLITESATAPAAGAAGWTSTAPTTIVTGASGLTTFYAWAKDAAGNVSTSMNASVDVIVSNFEQIDDFSTGFGNWSNVTGDTQDWSRGTSTPSSNTGPQSGDQGGDGYFAYTETSSPVTSSDTFYLESNNLDAGTYNLNVSFYWHMYGANMGSLSLDVWNGSAWTLGVWSRSGDNGDIWVQQSVDLAAAGFTSGTIKLRFRGTGASSWAGDAAIDTIRIYTAGGGGGDTSAPTVTAFSLPATSTSPITVSSFTATDNIAVTGYMITESNVAPAAGAAGWSPSAPTSITTGLLGNVTYYAWAKDAAGNVSASQPATVNITSAGGGGTTVNYYVTPGTVSSVPGAPTAHTACTDPTGAYSELLTTSSSNMCTTAYRYTLASTGLYSKHYFNTAFTAATTVTGTSYQVTMRDGGTVGFQLFYVNSSGTETLFGNQATITQGDAVTNNYIVDLSAQSATVPAGSKLGLRTWAVAVNPDFRIYLGNPDGRTGLISGHLIVVQQ